MVARKDEGLALLGDDGVLLGIVDFFLIDLHAEVVLQQVEQGVLLPHGLPKVGRLVPGGVGRVLDGLC